MRLRYLGVVLAVTAVLTAGCSSDTGTPSQDSSKGAENGHLATSGAVGTLHVDKSARSLLPADIRKAEVIKVGGATDVAPYLSVDGDSLHGLEADFMTAVGQVLGVKFDVTNTKFAAMVPGLESKRFDLAMSDFSDTPERQKQVTFIDYTKAGQVLIVPKGNPKGLKQLGDLCGHSAAGPAGSLSVQLATEQSTKCVKNGDEPVKVRRYPTAAESALALRSGRADTLAIDYGIASSLVKQSKGQLELSSKLFGIGLHGAAVRKEDKDLQQAVTRAFNVLISSGEYKKILKQWDLPMMAVSKVTINGQKQ